VTTITAVWATVLGVFNENPFQPENSRQAVSAYRAGHVLNTEDAELVAIETETKELLSDTQGQAERMEMQAAHLNDRSGKTPYDIEYQLQRKDGSYGWYRACGATLRDNDGVPLRVAGSLADISDRRS
jgi:PAS domain-containing protein